MKQYSRLVIILATVGLVSCQKVIDVNLNSADPQYVVEANVNDQPGPYTVRITRSANFSDDNNFPAVSGAFVTIKDVTAGVTDTLSDAGAGSYKTHTLNGITGHTYQLYIKVNGREFAASSTMPEAVSLDTVYTERSVFGGDDLFAVPVYTDPIRQGNRYRISQTVNRIPVKGGDVRSDEVTNGQKAKFPYYYDTDDKSGNPKIKSGDSVFMTLQSIDLGVYEFYRTLEDTREQNSPSLSNPLTNISGGALGYFCASANRTMGVKIP